jgi:hypothetical protein
MRFLLCFVALNCSLSSYLSYHRPVSSFPTQRALLLFPCGQVLLSYRASIESLASLVVFYRDFLTPLRVLGSHTPSEF